MTATSPQGADCDALTAAILRAERLTREGSADAPTTYAEVSRLEERLAAEHPADSVEGATARVGAVTAAVRAGQIDRARRLAARYGADPALAEGRRVEIAAALASWDGSCDACEVAAERYAATGDAQTCVCGRVHGPDSLRWPREPSPRARALPLPSVAPPGGSRLMLGTLRGEDEETVRVRRLLCELRPDRPGEPLGWGPYGEAPREPASPLGALANRIRVQTSADPSPIPRDYGRSAPRHTDGATVAARIRRLIDRDVAATLEWLQRHGTLARGLGELYRAAGQALATAEQRERWGVSRTAALDGPRVVGRRRVSEAMRVWWGEGDDRARGEVG